MDRYETVKLLGQGGEGAALLVKRKEDQQLFVCKKKTYISIDEANQGLQEAISLARFSSEFVTRYEDLFLQIRHEDGLSIFDLNLIMEFCAGGSIWDRLLGAREHSTSQESSSELELVPLVLVEKWIVEVCRGLKAVHQLKVMHRDLKSENIFLTAHDQVKIGDFGLATSAKTSKKDHSGTYHYMAPEVHRKQSHNSKADIWSLACIVFEASTSHLLPVDEIEFNRIVEQGGAELLRQTLAKYFPKDRVHILKLVEYMMEIDPLQRPNIDQVLEHEFFRQYTLQSEKAKALKQLTFEKLADSVKDGLSRQLNKRDVDATLDLLARELRDEPRMMFLFTKDAEKRHKLIRNVLLNYLVRFCAKKGNNLWGRYSPSGQLQAVAIWFPPDRALRPSFAQIIRVGMQNFGKIGVKTGVKIHQFTEFFEKTYQHDMPENSWILSYLAVDRELHGKGIGRHLLSHVFTVADYHGQDCVTLCFDGHGVDFFLKVGFTLLKTIPEPIKKSSCPPAQILIRRPRVDIDHALSSLTLSHSSSSELNASQQSSNKDKKRHSKHAL